MNASPTSLLRRVEEDNDLPVSARIRSRLIAAEQRYHANDNISAYVMDGEVDALRTEVEGKMAEVLKSLVIDTEGDHNAPILGKVWIGIMPNEHSNLIGLSKYARICDWVMSRPQIQEEAVIQLANILQDKVKPDGLAIVIEADHFCMHWRGVKDADSRMTNSVMRGSFLKDPDLRREFLSLLSKKNS